MTAYFRSRLWTLIVPILLIVVGYMAITRFAPTVHIPSAGEAPITAVGDEVPFLSVPEGFRATYYAKGVSGARVMEWDSAARLLVSQTSEGMVSVISDTDHNGTGDEVRTLIEDLDSPHGLAMRCHESGCELYVAVRNALLRYPYDPKTGTVSAPEKLLDLVGSITDRHKTRTLMFLGYPYENTLLISVGSSCDVCHEKDEMRGRISAYDISTGEISEYARGLRNATFMTLNPMNGFVFMTEMGRDGLGDTLPPDEVNYIDPVERAQIDTPPNFGWPICYGKNIHDTEFDKNTYVRNPCMHPSETQSWLDLEAHVAPLGLAFIPEEGWPEDWWFDLLVAQHGSWNRSDLVGYDIVKTSIDGRGNPSKSEAFISGWLTPEGDKLGRPADIKVHSGGVIYISDDYAGVVYKVSRIR